jgi:hypothetical protein
MEAKVPKNTGSCHETKDMSAKSMTALARRVFYFFLFLKNQSDKIKKGKTGWRDFLQSGLC